MTRKSSLRKFAFVSDLLDATARVIEKHGFIKGTLGYPNCGFCVQGALTFARRGYPRYPNQSGIECDALRYVDRAIGILHPRLPLYAQGYNDHHTTTKKKMLEVLSLAKRCAKRDESNAHA